jgi:hypothetical protein
MDETRIVLAGIWAALMLVYLLGDVLRIFSGDAVPGELDGKPATQSMWFGIAVIMLIPIAMIVLTLVVPYPTIRWINVAVAGFLVVFNALGLPYPSLYDNFLIGVGFVLNGLSIWYAWSWTV